MEEEKNLSNNILSNSNILSNFNFFVTKNDDLKTPTNSQQEKILSILSPDLFPSEEKKEEKIVEEEKIKEEKKEKKKKENKKNNLKELNKQKRKKINSGAFGFSFYKKMKKNPIQIVSNNKNNVKPNTKVENKLNQKNDSKDDSNFIIFEDINKLLENENLNFKNKQNDESIIINLNPEIFKENDFHVEKKLKFKKENDNIKVNNDNTKQNRVLPNWMKENNNQISNSMFFELDKSNIMKQV
jgi:hypothetical protein